jgi:hypothetical protein
MTLQSYPLIIRQYSRKLKLTSHQIGIQCLSALEKERGGVYLEMPQGFKHQGRVLRLKKSLYGPRQSPRKWFHHLKEKFQKLDSSRVIMVHACFFVSDRVICIFNVNDDTLFVSPRQRQEYIDEMLVKLEEAGLQLIGS